MTNLQQPPQMPPAYEQLRDAARRCEQQLETGPDPAALQPVWQAARACADTQGPNRPRLVRLLVPGSGGYEPLALAMRLTAAVCGTTLAPTVELDDHRRAVTGVDVVIDGPEWAVAATELVYLLLLGQINQYFPDGNWNGPASYEADSPETAALAWVEALVDEAGCSLAPWHLGGPRASANHTDHTMTAPRLSPLGWEAVFGTGGHLGRRPVEAWQDGQAMIVDPVDGCLRPAAVEEGFAGLEATERIIGVSGAEPGWHVETPTGNDRDRHTGLVYRRTVAAWALTASGKALPVVDTGEGPWAQISADLEQYGRLVDPGNPNKFDALPD